MEPCYLALIGNLQICFPPENEDYSDIGALDFIDVEIKIAKDGASYDMRGNEDLFEWIDVNYLEDNATDEKRSALVQRVVEGKVRPVMDRVVGCDHGEGKPCRTDIHRLAWALQEACVELAKQP